VIVIMVNDYREATYFIRATDSASRLLDGKNDYTITFPSDGLPPVSPERDGFWSLTLYTDDVFMLTDPANGRSNIGTVNLADDQLTFNQDGSLSLSLGAAEPTDPVGKANWLPAPAGRFALILRTYTPGEALFDGSYKLPDVVRSTGRIADSSATSA
jgi:hypothetical protein